MFLLFFEVKTSPCTAPETDLMWDYFGNHFGNRLGVVWRPEPYANQPKHTTSNQMQSTSNTIQPRSTQSKHTTLPVTTRSLTVFHYLTQSNAIQQIYATSNPMQSTSNAIQSISTQPKQSNHLKQCKCGMQRNPHNAIQSIFLPSGN